MTKDAWSKLSGKAQWDIIVSLRGPDIPRSDTIKWFTNSVIRGTVEGIMRVGGLVNRDLKLVILPSGPDSTPKGDTPSWDQRHFTSHICEAAGWLSLPVFILPNSVWWDLFWIGRPTAPRAMEGVLKWVKEQPDGSISDTYTEEIKRHNTTLQNGGW